MLRRSLVEQRPQGPALQLGAIRSGGDRFQPLGELRGDQSSRRTGLRGGKTDRARHRTVSLLFTGKTRGVVFR